MGSAGLSGYHDEARVSGPGVVIGRSGASFGRVHYCHDSFWPLNTALFVADFLENDPRFVYFALKTIPFSRFNSGSAQPSLNRNFIASIPMAIPPLAEQQRIAQTLGSFDDKVDNNRRLEAILDEMITTVYRDRFVKAAAESKYEQVSKRISPEWRMSPLTDGIELLSGGTPPTSESRYWGGRIPWVSIKDTTTGIYVVATEKHVSGQALSDTRLRLYPRDTVIVTARGTVGNVAFMSEPMTLNQSCYAVQGRDGVSQLYVYCVIRQAVDTLRARAHGSVFATITRSTFESIHIAWPPTNIINDFDRDMRPLFALIHNGAQETATLTSLRDTLLPKLISGEIRVPDTNDPDEVIGHAAEQLAETVR
jgi:type I restriction enzyme, S subunit